MAITNQARKHLRVSIDTSQSDQVIAIGLLQLELKHFLHEAGEILPARHLLRPALERLYDAFATVNELRSIESEWREGE